jgi:hypothetical protein
VGKQTKLITKMCKNSSLKKISFKTENTTGKLLKVNKNINKNLLNVVFNQLACPDCNMKYIRQTGRPFHVRFKVHSCDFKYENGKSKFAQHLLQNKHSTGPIEDTKEILQITRKKQNDEYL